MDIFITGTDTDVGKTIVTAGLAAVMQGLGYSVGVYKPVQSGALTINNKLIAPDLRFVKHIDSNILTKSTYKLRQPLSPALAATLDNVRINKSFFVRDYTAFKKYCDIVLVEGAGGLLVPVYENFLIRDLVKTLNLPLLIVARPNRGTINHTLLTIEAAKTFGIDIIGVIISNYPSNTRDIGIKTAPSTIFELSGVKVLGILPHIKGLGQNRINPEFLIDAVINNVDIQEVFRMKIPKLSDNL